MEHLIDSFEPMLKKWFSVSETMLDSIHLMMDAQRNRDHSTQGRFLLLAHLLEFISEQVGLSDTDCANGNGEQWTEIDNDRRIALINKKHDRKLTKPEQEELRRLQDRAYRHRDQVAPVRNEVLRLLLEALEHRAQSAP